MPRRRILLSLLLAALSLIALSAPAGASAADGFAGVLENGTLVRFQSDSITGLSSPVRIRGLAPRDQVVALGSGGGRVYAVGSSARLYRLDVKGARATPVGGVFPTGLRGRRFSLAVSPDGTQGRLLSDVGQDLLVDLATGATQDGPGLRIAANGEQTYPAAAFLPDGRLAGLDLGRKQLVRETRPGSNVFDTAPYPGVPAFTAAEPIAFTTAPDGRAWLLVSFGSRNRVRQSLFQRVDVAAGTFTRDFEPFLRRLTTMAWIGTVPDDTRVPAVRLRIPRSLSYRDLLDHRLRIALRVGEGGQTLASLRVGGKASTGGETVGFGLFTRDTPGPVVFRDWSVLGHDRVTLRKAIGRRIRIVLSVHDWAGNKRTIVRSVLLTK